MIQRFFSQSWLYFKAHAAAFRLEEFVLFETGYPLLTLVFYCVLAGYSFNTSDLTHWVVGNSFLLCVNSCIFRLGNGFRGERYTGRIRSIIVSPSNKLVIVLQQGFIQMFVEAAKVFIGFIAGSLIFGVDFSGINMGLLTLVILTAMFAATGFALLLSVFGLLTDEMNMVLNLSYYALMILCGANFPAAQLPAAGRLVSRLMPLTRSIEAADMLFQGFDGAAFTRLLCGEVIVGAAYCALGFVIVKAAERAAIRRAALEMF